MIYIRVFDGIIRSGEKARFFAHNHEYDITEAVMLLEMDIFEAHASFYLLVQAIN